MGDSGTILWTTIQNMLGDQALCRILARKRAIRNWKTQPFDPSYGKSIAAETHPELEQKSLPRARRPPASCIAVLSCPYKLGKGGSHCAGISPIHAPIRQLLRKTYDHIHLRSLERCLLHSSSLTSLPKQMGCCRGCLCLIGVGC